jgi:rod shape-determining protein MreC
MQWIFQLIVRYRNVSSLFLMVFLSLWMVSGTHPQQQQISRVLTLTIFYPFQVLVEQATRIHNIYNENRHLKEQATDLITRLALLQEESSENKRLRELLKLRDRLVYTLLPARVIAHEPSHVVRSAVINVGTNKGVVRYFPLVNNYGVIGRVIQVLPYTSLVQLLKDPSNRTSVMLKRSRVVAILETEDGDNFYIRCLPHSDIKAGDTLITSGLGGIYPKGLYAGTVQEIRDESDPLFMKAVIKPMVDFNNLEEVFVIKLSPQWMSFRSEIDSLGLRQ